MMIFLLTAAILALLGAGYAAGRSVGYATGFLYGQEAGQENALKLFREWSDEHQPEVKS